MGLAALPLVWGQTAGTNPGAFALLALRRWYGSLTLSSPEPTPGLPGLGPWLAGLLALLLLAMVAQGPGRALRQLLDVRGHLRLLRESWRRLRGSGRMVAATIGLTVLAWTASQAVSFNRAAAKDDLVMLLKSRGHGPLALEQGLLATLTPLRDVAGLGDNLPLLIAATVLIFRAAMERMSGVYVPGQPSRPAASGWENVLWGGAGLYILYRVVSMGSGTAGGLPLGGCLIVEVVVVPALMMLSDGCLLAWVLVELRNAGLGDGGGERIETDAVVELMPGAALACLAALPARYVATGVLLAGMQIPASAGSTELGRYVRWQLGEGLADLQGAALVVVGLAGAVAWTRGTPGGALRGYRRLLRAEGGRLLALLAGAGAGAGAVSVLAYFLVLSLPASTWALAAADSYAHYASLPIGLLTLSALVELGERSLPEATLVAPAAEPGAVADEVAASSPS